MSSNTISKLDPQQVPSLCRWQCLPFAAVKPDYRAASFGYDQSMGMMPEVARDAMFLLQVQNMMVHADQGIGECTCCLHSDRLLVQMCTGTPSMHKCSFSGLHAHSHVPAALKALHLQLPKQTCGHCATGWLHRYYRMKRQDAAVNSATSTNNSPHPSQ